MSAKSTSEIEGFGSKILNLVINTMKENLLENVNKNTPKV